MTCFTLSPAAICLPRWEILHYIPLEHQEVMRVLNYTSGFSRKYGYKEVLRAPYVLSVSRGLPHPAAIRSHSGHEDKRHCIRSPSPALSNFFESPLLRGLDTS